MVAAAAPGPAPAQSPIRQETGLDLLVVGAEPSRFLAGVSSWWRPAPRTRLGGGVAAGVAGGTLAGEGRVAAHFLLNPAARTGASFYGGGGLAVSAGDVGGTHIVVLLGLESRAGSVGGWAVEAGLGGGVRLAVGWRWRVARRPSGRE